MVTRICALSGKAFEIEAFYGDEICGECIQCQVYELLMEPECGHC